MLEITQTLLKSCNEASSDLAQEIDYHLEWKMLDSANQSSPPPPVVEPGTCVFCEAPFKSVGDDAFKFVGTHDSTFTYVTCAKCIFKTMYMTIPHPESLARAVGYIYRP